MKNKGIDTSLHWFPQKGIDTSLHRFQRLRITLFCFSFAARSHRDSRYSAQVKLSRSVMATLSRPSTIVRCLL
jgi:hypothetical protein